MLRTVGVAVSMAAAVGVCVLAGGCGSSPPAEVSKSELAAVRKTHAAVKVGESKQKVLDSYKAANKVKLGASELGGATIEEWKVEAFHDEKKRKDLFVTFLYFRNDRFVDSSDTRIDFRNNASIVEGWSGGGRSATQEQERSK